MPMAAIAPRTAPPLVPPNRGPLSRIKLSKLNSLGKPDLRSGAARDGKKQRVCADTAACDVHVKADEVQDATGHARSS